MELLHLRPVHGGAQLDGLPHGGAARRHPRGGQGPDRGGAQSRHDELADDDEGGFPPGGEELHPRHRQRVHHQHHGFVGSVGHRRYGPHVRDKVRERHLLPLAGDLLRGGASVPGADLAVVAALKVAEQEAGHAGARHSELELKEAAA